MKNSWLLLPVILVIAILGGCTETKQPLRVGLLIWPAYELPYLARERGYFEDQPIQLVEYYSPAEVLRAYSSGALDAIAVTVDYALQLAVNDPEHRIIMVIDASHGGDALLAKPEITSLQALAGKRIGIERSVLGAFMLRRALDHANLEEEQIEVVSVDLPDTVAAYREERVDAVITYEPYRSRIRALGAGELFSSKDIPGEIVDVLVARRDTVDGHATTFSALISGWLRAAEELQKNPLSSAEVLSVREKMTPQAFLAALDDMQLMDFNDNSALLTGPNPAILEALRRQFKVMQEEQLIQSVPDYKAMIDGRFFKKPAP